MTITIKDVKRIKVYIDLYIVLALVSLDDQGFSWKMLSHPSRKVVMSAKEIEEAKIAARRKIKEQKAKLVTSPEANASLARDVTLDELLLCGHYTEGYDVPVNLIGIDTQSDEHNADTRFIWSNDLYTFLKSKQNELGAFELYFDNPYPIQLKTTGYESEARHFVVIKETGLKKEDKEVFSSDSWIECCQMKDLFATQLDMPQNLANKNTAYALFTVKPKSVFDSIVVFCMHPRACVDFAIWKQQNPLSEEDEKRITEFSRAFLNEFISAGCNISLLERSLHTDSEKEAFLSFYRWENGAASFETFFEKIKDLDIPIKK